MAQNEIQDVNFNGVVAGSLFLFSPDIGLTVAALISDSVATWQTAFTAGTVSAIAGGLRFEFTGLYGNTNYTIFTILVDTSGLVTVSTHQQGVPIPPGYAEGELFDFPLEGLLVQDQ